jgi:hypothetical protein
VPSRRCSSQLLGSDYHFGMTQILTLLTHDTVIQVSDRRVSFPHRAPDDLRNKATIYLTLAAFGYTGLASLAGHPTDLWMTEVLGPTMGLGEGFDALRLAANRDVPKRERLAMVCGGWDPKPNTFAAFVATIDNCLPRDLPRVRERRPTRNSTGVMAGRFGPARNEFTWFAVALQPSLSCLLHIAGQPLLRGQEDTLLRDVKRALVARADDVALVRILAEAIWRVARENTYVGRSLMATCLPKSAARRSGPLQLVSGPPSREHFTAMYLPSPDADAIYYLPNLAGGNTVMTSGMVEPL